MGLPAAAFSTFIAGNSGSTPAWKCPHDFRYSPLQADTILQRTDWSRVTGEWLEAYCRVTFSESGDFVRPKWGIYRSILDWDNLRSEEEAVRFANFSVSEVMLSN